MKKFGVISCSDDKKWGFSEAIISRYLEFFSLNSEQEQWVGFHATRGEVPLTEDLHKFDGFVISGSISSANDNVEWIVKLLEFIRSAADLSKEKKRPKIVGICFGHQLIAKALGGKVGLNPDKDFVLQTELIEVTIQAFEAESIKGLFDKGPLRAVQSHGECVVELPEGAVSLATSPTCKYEVVQYKENILGFQCHPEMYASEAEELILPHIAKSRKWDAIHVKKSSDSFKMEWIKW
ncbi:putative glutamine amidotransferase [Exaiptasia diaphana]|nr:putative glutamine amidotransferase [Exaiptasia diaphana]